MTDQTTTKIQLNALQRRVLGVLIEKALANPEYYPLTLKALIAGCNQKSNRNPVTNTGEEEVERALEQLESAGLVTNVLPLSGRAVRYRQDLGQRLELSATQLAVVGELLLRGEQSEGELRSRASRMRPIADLATLRELLAELSARRPPIVQRLSPQSSSRGVRWTHALGTETRTDRPLTHVESRSGATTAETKSAASTPESNARQGPDPHALSSRMNALEHRVTELERRLKDRGENGRDR